MKTFMAKLKYFSAGFLVAIVLSVAVAAFAVPETRQLFFGVDVVIGEKTLELEGIDKPFILDGRTFLPVSVIAQALDIPIEWDADTQTVYVGIRSPLVGHWRAIASNDITEEEFSAQNEELGYLDIIFYPDGRMDTFEGDFLIRERWRLDGGWLLVLDNISVTGHRISDDGILELYDIHGSGEWLRLIRID